jgi:uncharacterized oligopeptide transporter (OPT) family protein
VDARRWWDRDLERAAEGTSPTLLRWGMVLFGIVLVANVVRLGLADTGAQVLLAVVGVALSVVVLILSFAIHRRQVARPA